MRKIYHILGADITHHNHTILQFFAYQLRDKIPPEGYFSFWGVGHSLAKDYSVLNIKEFQSQFQLVKQMILLAKRESSCHFFLHGQFNFFLWFAIIFNLLPQERVTWHIWGADLYENSHRFIFKLLYPLRRIAQKRLRLVVGTKGDLAHFQRLNPYADCDVLYFPTKMDLAHIPQYVQKNEKLTILIGNSGDPSNQHLKILSQIKQKLGEHVHLVIPMGYPNHNQKYISKVKNYANQLFFGNSIEVLEEKLKFDDYLTVINRCDLGCFLFERQQGIGTICLLLQFNVPLVLNEKNPFLLDLAAYNIPFLVMDELDEYRILEIKQKLTALDKKNIPFFAPNYAIEWVNIINKIITKG